jgi:hypothetical protein
LYLLSAIIKDHWFLSSSLEVLWVRRPTLDEVTSEMAVVSERCNNALVTGMAFDLFNVSARSEPI